jgi:hypothetical protein
MYSFCAPDDGRRNRLKHVDQFIEINRSRKTYILLVVLWRYVLAMHGHMNVKVIKLLYMFQSVPSLIIRSTKL